MDFIDGPPLKEPIVDWNRKFILEEKGEISEERARYVLGKFLMYNLGFTVRILTGWIIEPYQRLVLKGWLAKNYTLTVAGRGWSKCIDENSTVLTENGFKAIKDTYVGEQIWADKGMQEIQAKTVNPKEDGYTITTKCGFVCTGKKGHKIKYLNPETFEMGWKQIEDFNGEEIIPIRRNMNQWGNKNPINGFTAQVANQAKQLTLIHEPDLYYLMGLILGDGCLRHTGGTIGVTSMDREIGDFIKRVIPKYIEDGKTWSSSKGVDAKASSYEFSSIPFKQFLTYMGMNSEKAVDKVFPIQIMTTGKPYVTAFLRGLYDTDGYARVEHDNKRNRWTCWVGLSSSSWDIIKKTQSILLNLGIIASIKHSHKAGPQLFSNGNTYETHDSWSLVISNRDSIEIFSREIGFGLPRKQEKLDKYLVNVGHRKYHFNLIEIGQYLKTKYAPYQFRNKGLKLHGSISLARLKKVRDFNFIDQEDKSKFGAMLDNDYYFDTVKTIKPIQTVSIDIQVANEACYWSDGFINHNSWLFSHFCYLYCLMNPGKHIVMVSATFRSSRRILENIEEWSQRKPSKGDPGGTLLRQCFDGDMRRMQDLYKIKFKNGSSITALPLGDPNKLRGHRCSVLGIDEALLISQSTIDNVLKPFLFATPPEEARRRQQVREKEREEIKAGKREPGDVAKFDSQAKMILLSSASYSWEELYTTYKNYIKAITQAEDAAIEKLDDQDATYMIHQLSYETANPDMMDKASLEELKSGMLSEMTVRREFKAQFVQDSDGYFSAVKLAKNTIPDGDEPCIEIVGELGAEYVLAIDQNAADTATSDHFAMCVLKIVTKKRADGTETKMGMVVHQYAETGEVPLKEHIEYLYYILTNFNIVYMGYDASGGKNLGFTSIANTSELFRTKKLELKEVKADFGKENYDEIIKQVQKYYNRENKVIVQPQSFHSDFQRAANEHLQACLDRGTILFAGKARAAREKHVLANLLNQDVGPILYKHSRFADPENPTAKGGASQELLIEQQDVLIDLVKKECSLIEVRQSQLGHITYDIPQHMKRNHKSKNRVRKDSYAALLLANWCLRVYTDMMNKPKEEHDDYIPIGWVR